MIYHSCTFDTITYLRKSLGLFLLRGLEVLNQVFPIYLVTLKIIIMFLSALFLILTLLAGISVPVIQQTIKIMIQSYLELQKYWVTQSVYFRLATTVELDIWGLQMISSHYAV